MFWDVTLVRLARNELTMSLCLLRSKPSVDCFIPLRNIARGKEVL